MTLYTLDTNAVAAVLRRDQGFLERLTRALLDGHRVTVNAISYFETRRGLIEPHHTRKVKEFERLLGQAGVLDLNLPGLDRAADAYQILRAAGTPLEDADLLVAGIALSHDAVLVTRNVRHLGRVPGLRLEDWESEP